MLQKMAIVVIGLMLVGAQATAAEPGRHFINGSSSPSRASLPFSDGVLVGDTLYISGQIGIDPKTDMAAADPRVEAKNVMDRVKAAVEAAGLSMDEVVSMQIHCTDLALYDLFNEVYRGYFPHGFPARAFLGASTLLRGAHFEVLGIAVKRNLPGASDNNAANTAIARRVFAEILTKGRFELAKDLYSPTFINHGLHSGVGLAEDQSMAQGWKAAFPDLVISVDRTIAEGDDVSVIWTARGTNTGKGNGLPGNGRTIEVRGITVWRIIAGKIQDEWSEFDTTEMLRQLGVTPH